MSPSITVSPHHPVGVVAAQAALAAARASGESCDVMCSQCERRLACVSRYSLPDKLGDRLSILEESDACRWCARPISARGEALAPLEGYIRLARLVAREPARFHPAAEVA